MTKEDFTKLGFNSHQATDLLIMMRLSCRQDMEDWMRAVGADDVEYGINLLQTAAELLEAFEIDMKVDDMKNFKEAMTAINGVK